MYFPIYRSERYLVTASRMGDAVLMRLHDGREAYFQTGDDANQFRDELERAEEVFGEDAARIDHILSQYDDVMSDAESIGLTNDEAWEEARRLNDASDREGEIFVAELSSPDKWAVVRYIGDARKGWTFDRVVLYGRAGG